MKNLKSKLFLAVALITGIALYCFNTSVCTTSNLSSINVVADDTTATDSLAIAFISNEEDTVANDTIPAELFYSMMCDTTAKDSLGIAFISNEEDTVATDTISADLFASLMCDTTKKDTTSMYSNLLVFLCDTTVADTTAKSLFFAMK